ncbi:bifunctional diguanylate cyclase/phosphodiesterase [Marinobacter sp. S0848L]|uniref:putative bifunctional diguanylate cyclase/phosphodiesterase n=1 Tax=Marinobacter sp. S0848L TaxID=2926423 RepID=UPI001FF6170F|nr:bifunctional diguanylate cyclase/phosphodiesterase [Marinobacter sp. S0848L]MCK0106008.1 bifunctional diguanylate cyclase/phosphodiesterase [Marinobacter sp. S0848L]
MKTNLIEEVLGHIRTPSAPDELLTLVETAIRKHPLIQSHVAIQSRLEKSEALHRYIVNNSPDIVFMLDEAGRFCFINNKVESLLGYSPAELCGQHFRYILDEQDVARGAYAVRGPNISADNPRSLEVLLKVKGQKTATRHFEITAFPIEPQSWPHSDESLSGCIPQLARYYGTARDVTDRKEAEAFINFQTYHDPLTRLPNRALFKDRLELAAAHARRNHHKLAVMFLDLDRFKVINNTLGHAMGDRLLQAVTQRMEKCLRHGDTLSRFGGDEFTILLPVIHGTDDARSVAKKLIAALQNPFQLGNHEVFVGASIGIALFPDAGQTMEQLLQCADAAMYYVKARGKDGYRFHSKNMRTTTTQRLRMERDLRLAMEREEFQVHYQPQVCSKTHRMVGVEALVRWQHPTLGLLYPVDFLPLAEETGLIAKLSEKVLSHACKEVGNWIASGHPDLRLAVNLSPSQVEHPRFVEMLTKRIKANGFPKENLEIEITENVIMKDLERISSKFKDLASSGIRIAIDDFGTGYSSLNYLHRLPIHTLKVDQSFVKAIRSGEEGACIVNAIVAMAHGLKLEIVAEGVETGEQLSYLKKLGCQQVQGFFYGPAQPASEISKILNAKDRCLVHRPHN